MTRRPESPKACGLAYIFSLTLVGVALFIAGCAQEPGQSESEVVIARLGKAAGDAVEPGGRVITLGRLNSALEALMPGSVEEGYELTGPDGDFKKSVLNELIEEELVIAEAERLGLTISTEELNSEEALLRENLDDDAFFTAIIPRYGTIERWKEEIGRKLLIRKVLEKVVSSGEHVSPVSDGEARNYYDSNRADYDMPAQARASMIVVESAEKASAALSRLATEEFSAVAKELSTGPEAASGGDLGFFGRGDMPQEFEEVVFSLEAGEMSGVVNSPYGFHIFHVVARNDGRKLEFEDVREEIKAKLKRDREDEYYRQWILELKKNTDIKIMREF